MADKSSDLVQGTLDMLILKTLDLEPMHGYGISARIEQISKGVFRRQRGFVVCRVSTAATSGTGQRRMESHGK
jgi:PadR family transcriptional regulator, regulatory protein PadR